MLLFFSDIAFADLFDATPDVVVDDFVGFVGISWQNLFDPITLVVLESHFAHGTIFKSNQVPIFVISGKIQIIVSTITQGIVIFFSK